MQHKKEEGGSDEEGMLRYIAYKKPRAEQIELVKDFEWFYKGNFKTFLFKGQCGLGKEACVAASIVVNLNKYDRFFYLIPKDTAKDAIEREFKLIEEKINMKIPYITLYGKNRSRKINGKLEYMCNMREQHKEADAYELCTALGDKCPCYDECRYYAQKRQIKDAKIIVCDYNYIFNPIIRNSAMSGLLDGNYVVYINECHQLDRRLFENLTNEKELRTFQLALTELRDNQHLDKSIPNKIRWLERWIHDINKMQKNRFRKDGYLQMDKNLFQRQDYLEAVEGIEIGKAIIRHKISGQTGSISHFFRVCNFISNWFRYKDTPIVHYIKEVETKKYTSYTIGFSSLWCGSIIKPIFSEAQKIVMFSGTCYRNKVMGLFKLEKYGKILQKDYRSHLTEKRKDIFFCNGEIKYKDRENPETFQPIINELMGIIKRAPKPLTIFSVSAIKDKLFQSKDFKKFMKKYKYVQEDENSKINKEAFKKKVLRSDVSFISPIGSFSESVDLSEKNKSINSTMIIGIPDLKVTLITEKRIQLLMNWYKYKANWAYELINRFPAIEMSIQCMSRSIRREKDKLPAVWMDNRWINYQGYIDNKNKVELDDVDAVCKELGG